MEETKTWIPLDHLGSYRLRKFTYAKLLLLVNLNQEVTIKPKAKSFYVVIQKYTYIIGEIWNKYFFKNNQ